MGNKFEGLTGEFRNALSRVLKGCNAKDIEMRFIEGERNPFIQAKYWRQSRSIKEINAKINQLKDQNAHFLAYCIEMIGSHHGNHVTNAIPGLSWHQWGEAADFAWIVKGKICWDTSVKIAGQNGYEVYANEAKLIGLDCGFFWKGFQDAGHIQLRSARTPEDLIKISDIDYQMQLRYENLLL